MSVNKHNFHHYVDAVSLIWQLEHFSVNTSYIIPNYTAKSMVVVISHPSSCCCCCCCCKVNVFRFCVFPLSKSDSKR